jgi:hypothetical protein
MVWIDEYKWNPQNASVQSTLGGGRIVQNFIKTLETGRLITLQTLDGQGYQKKNTIDSLLVLAEQPEAIFTLSISHNDLTIEKQVRLANEIEGGAIQFDMSAAMNGLQTDSFYYSGTIFLEIV